MDAQTHEAQMHLKDLLSDRNNFSYEAVKPLFIMESLDRCQGDMAEEENNIIEEINALRGVIAGVKTVSTWSYMYSHATESSHAIFFQTRIIPELMSHFPEQLAVEVSTHGSVVAFNPNSSFSVFCKDTIMANSSGQYNFDQGFFGEELEQQPLFDRETIKSVILGYDKWTTVCFQLTGIAFNTTYQEMQVALGDNVDDEEVIKQSVPLLQMLRENQELVASLAQRYDYNFAVVDASFRAR